MKTAPLISILMPVFNAGPYVADSIRSLLRQSLGDFELLVIDDGSRDDTCAEVLRFKDARVQLHRNEHNRGIAATLNRGLDLAKGTYVARMDGDDICDRRRLELQVRYFAGHPNAGALGSSVRLCGALHGRLLAPSGSDCVRAFLLFGNPLAHSSVMMRREVIEAHHLRYDPAFSRTEDYELWVRASRICELDNLSEPLLALRMHEASIRQCHREEMRRQAGVIIAPMLADLGLHLSPEELAFHLSVGQGDRLNEKTDIRRAEQWLMHILDCNRTAKVLQDGGLRRAAGLVWFRLCMNSAQLGPWIWQYHAASPLKGAWTAGGYGQAAFLASIVRNWVRR